MRHLLTALACLIAFTAATQEVYTVETKVKKAAISPIIWGLFFEDINRSADGGIYAELVKNRSFDYPKPMTGWTTWPSNRVRDGIFIITNQMAENMADPKYMAVTVQIGDTVGLINEGFGGIPLKKGLPYALTLRYRQQAAGVHLRAFLFNSISRPIGHVSITPLEPGADWQEQTVNIIPGDSASKGKLLVIFEGAGHMDVDRISLFPTDTWKGRPGGLRADLVQILADLHPGFLRFPGGCIVEGNQLIHRYQWKHTIGPLQDREPVQSIWADDVPDRPTPDYMESFGLGFYEYFQLCEDIGAAPLPIVNCGMSCQFDAAEVTPINELEPYILDALDLIEFANGGVDTKWGAKRVALGHPDSFHMTMLGVGNENWGPQYAERLELFTKRIKERYPDIQLVCASGYSPNPRTFHYMDSVLRTRHADIIDEHFYMPPEWFLQNATRYDGYDRKGPKIFVGEFAAQSDRIGSLKNVNNLRTALAEAAFMTGIERNTDVVTMASYAPLFAHVNDWQWTPNLIWFDNSRSYATPNYYVQQLFSMNRGTEGVPILRQGQPVIGRDSCWASACMDEITGELILKLVNPSGKTMERAIRIGDARLAGEATVTTLTGTGPAEMNSIEALMGIAPKARQLALKGNKMQLNLPAYSFVVVRVKVK
jgi:alpha-N-arabinofuranosidase